MGQGKRLPNLLRIPAVRAPFLRVGAGPGELPFGAAVRLSRCRVLPLAEALALLLFQVPGDPAPDRPLEVGQVLRDAIRASDPTTRTKRLDEGFTPIAVRAKAYSLEVAESGRYHLRLTSRSFDTYLILRDSRGNLLAEDDDGWINSQSLLTSDLRAREGYTVFACALHGGIGDFEISVRPGEPTAPKAEERASWKSDARAAASKRRWQGEWLLEEGQIDPAQPLFEEALGLAEGKLGEESQETAACRYDLARLLAIKNEFSKAHALLEGAIRTQERLLGPGDLQTCDSYQELGAVYLKQGDFQRAKPLFEKALKGLLGLPASEENRVSHAVLLRRAVVSFRMGDWSSSERYFQSCLSLAAKCYGKEDPLVAHHLTMLGTCQLLQGDRVQARLHYERAQTVQERQGRGQAPFTTEIRRRLAALAMEEGNYDYARHLLKIALKEAEAAEEPENLQVAFALSLLGSLRYFEGDYSEAEPVCERSLSIFDRLLGEKSYFGLDCRITLANTKMELLNLAEARALLERAERQNEQALDRMYHSTKIRLHEAFGRLHFLEGDLGKAQERLNAATELALQHSPDNALSSVQTLHESTRIALERGNPQEAWLYACKAYSAAASNFHRIAWSLSESERYDLALTQRMALDTLLDLAGPSPDPDASGFVFDALVGWKARIFRGMLSTKQSVFAASRPETFEAIARLRRVQSQISLLGSQDPTDAPFIAYQMEELQKRRSELEKTIARSLGPGDVGVSIDWKAQRRLLPPGASLVNFIEHRRYRPSVRESGRVVEKASWSPPLLSAWILSSETEAPRCVRLGPSSEIEEALKRFLSELAVRKPSATGSRDSRLSKLNDEVYEKVWAPLAGHLRGDLVLISADGCLGTLPFGVIQRRNGRYLIEDYSFLCLQDTAGLERFTGPPAEHEGDLLVVGGVDFRNPAPSKDAASGSDGTLAVDRGIRAGFRSSWPALPLTIDEADAIARLHQEAFPERSRLFLQGEAPTEERLKGELPRFSLIHIASHGFFVPEGLPSFWDRARSTSPGAADKMERPSLRYRGLMPGLLSGIVCAGANLPVEGNRENGLLTAEELSWMDLSRCDLVVLSACQTGLGTVRAGEGMIGLRSALRQAGAKTVIGSLWSVGDESTKELMESFYKALWKEGRGKLEALRGAQLRMLDKQKQLYNGQAFPYAWGAFVLDGDWR